MHGQRHKTNQNEPKRCDTIQRDTTRCKLKETKNKQLNETARIQTTRNKQRTTTLNNANQHKHEHNTPKQKTIYNRRNKMKQSRPTQPITERGNALQKKGTETEPCSAEQHNMHVTISRRNRIKVEILRNVLIKSERVDRNAAGSLELEAERVGESQKTVCEPAPQNLLEI